MPSDPRATRIITGYRREVLRTRAAVASVVQANWRTLDTYRDADIARFAHRTGLVLNGAQRHLAVATAAYLVAVKHSKLGTPLRPIPVPSHLTVDLRGIPSTELMARTGPAVWWELSKGSGIGAAAEAGLTRGLAMAATNLQLATTTTSQFVLADDQQVAGYLRVIESDNPCDLCLAASTNVYHSEDLLPIHDGCSCSVDPIYGTSHQEAADQFRSDLHALADASPEPPADPGTEVAVEQHGELGPVLVDGGQHFRGPDDVPDTGD